MLNAWANLCNTKKFLQLFNKMNGFGAKPDVSTYNFMIKLCARADLEFFFTTFTKELCFEPNPFELAANI